MARPQSKPVVRAATTAAHPAAAYAAPAPVAAVVPTPAPQAPEPAVPDVEKVATFTTRLPRSVHRRLKSAAAIEGRTIEAVMRDLIEEYLDGKP